MLSYSICVRKQLPNISTSRETHKFKLMTQNLEITQSVLQNNKEMNMK